MEQRTWNICKEGRTLITFTSMLDMSVQKSTDIPTEPLEASSFASYNRTQNPKEYSVTLALAGDNAELQKAQETLERLASGTETFELVTPDYEHENLALVSYDYSRERTSANGLLVVKLSIREIREVETGTATLTIAKVKNPSCASKQEPSQKTKDSIEKSSNSMRSMMRIGIDGISGKKAS